MAQDSKDSIKSLAARMEKAKVEKENLLFAMNGYDELLRIKPNDAELWLGKAGALEKTSYSLEDRLYCYEQTTLESAIWYWDWILELWPLWLTAQEGRISCYLQHNKKDEAIAVCDGQI